MSKKKKKKNKKNRNKTPKKTEYVSKVNLLEYIKNVPLPSINPDHILEVTQKKETVRCICLSGGICYNIKDLCFLSDEAEESIERLTYCFKDIPLENLWITKDFVKDFSVWVKRLEKNEGNKQDEKETSN